MEPNGCLNNMGYSDAGMAKGEAKPLIGLTLDGLRRVAEVCGMPRFAVRWHAGSMRSGSGGLMI